MIIILMFLQKKNNNNNNINGNYMKVYILFIYITILVFNVKYYYLPSEILIFKKIQNKKTSTCKLQLKMEGMCESGGQEIFILSFTFIYSNKDFAFL